MQAKRVCQALVIMAALAISLKAAPQYDHEIVVIVREGTIQMPLGATSAPVEDVTFNPPAIKQTLLDHSA